MKLFENDLEGRKISAVLLLAIALEVGSKYPPVMPRGDNSLSLASSAIPGQARTNNPWGLPREQDTLSATSSSSSGDFRTNSPRGMPRDHPVLPAAHPTTPRESASTLSPPSSMPRNYKPLPPAPPTTPRDSDSTHSALTQKPLFITDYLLSLGNRGLFIHEIKNGHMTHEIGQGYPPRVTPPDHNDVSMYHDNEEVNMIHERTLSELISEAKSGITIASNAQLSTHHGIQFPGILSYQPPRTDQQGVGRRQSEEYNSGPSQNPETDE